MIDNTSGTTIPYPAMRLVLRELCLLNAKRSDLGFHSAGDYVSGKKSLLMVG